MKLPEGTKEERLSSFIKQLEEQVSLKSEYANYEISSNVDHEALLKKELLDYQVILNLLKQI